MFRIYFPYYEKLKSVVEKFALYNKILILQGTVIQYGFLLYI
jgi:hypothetical protein